MHKGRDYALEQHVRVFMGDATYPRWCAEAYMWELIGTGAWMGTAPLPTNDGPFVLEFAGIDYSDKSFSMRDIVGTYGGRLVEIGFIGWLQDPPIRCNISRMVWCDGVEQLVRGPTSGGSSTHWELLQSSSGVVPVTGAEIWNTWHYVGTPVPY